ncbi:MAG TPA: amidohydrolase family protein [Candidatus Sulfotelmatobacter sp.]|nr:amidohydrolase family protein [Candidatus Sulfotelmatobacter sp.]
MAYDLKITGGHIVDGSGTPRYAGDVGIKDGKVVALGAAPEAARESIDATGRVVAPGFVDIHTHYDAQIIWDRMLTISPWHGVTTVVMGNCGFGVAPTRPQHRDLIVRTLEKVEGMSVASLQAGLGEEWPFETFPQYLDAIAARGSAINVGVLLGHTPLRLYVMGEAATERPAGEAEVKQMRALVREAIEAGAVGLATSKAATHVGFAGKPVPSRAAEFSEVEALASVLGETGKGMMQATIGRGLLFDEFAKLSRDNGINVSWTALLAGRSRRGVGYREQLARSMELIGQGYKVYPQVTPRPLNFEYQMKEPFVFESMSLFKPVSAADVAGRRRLYEDGGFRQAFRTRMDGVASDFAAGFGATVISECASDRGLEERRLAEVALERGQHPVDLLLDLALATNLEARFRMPVANHDEDEVAELLLNPDMVLGLSDAGAHASQLCDACQGTYLLARWVREKKALSLETAIRMLTSRPAEVFGIADRGRLALGRPADVVVFDPDTIGAGPLKRVTDQPGGANRLISEASGIDAVIVNGTILRRHGKDALAADGALPGKLLRNGRAA